MANEITKVTDQNGVDHPFKDVAAFPRSEQRVLGAKNLADFVDGKSINPSGIVENYADRIATVNPILINSGVGYKVTWTSEDTDVRCIYAVWNGSTLVRRELGITKDTVLNTSGGDKLYVCLYSDAQAVAVNTHKPMVILSTDTDSTYAPYAMTNKELTEKVANLGTKTGVTTGSTSVPNNAFTQIAQVTVPKGPCLIHARACIDAELTAYEIALSISSSSSSSSTARNRTVTGVASTITATGIGDFLYLNNSTETTEYLWFKHNKGEAVTVYPTFEVIQL